MVKCCIRGCTSSSLKKDEALSFFRFPKNEPLKKLWTDNIGTENIKPAKVLRICSKHFEEACINRTLEVVRLKDDACPTIFPFTSSSVQLRMPLLSSSENIVYTTSASAAHCSSQFTSSSVQLRMPLLSSSENIVYTTSASAAHCSSQFTSSSVQLRMPFLSSSENIVYTTSASAAHCSSQIQSDTSEKKIQTFETQIQQQKKKIKMLSQKCRRLKRKVLTYQNLIDELKKQNLIPREGAILLEECAGSPEFLRRQILKNRRESCPRSYGGDIRKFALTLNFLSPKAYQYVRKIYKNCLPHPRTLSKWYQHVDAEPGFTSEAFQTLKIKAQNSARPILCTLIIDEMAIRKGLYWDNSKKKFYGRVNTGIIDESDSTEEANECFVMLLTAINEAWKLPVGYFFINTLTGEQKAHLVQVCVDMVAATGVNVVALTCDGPAANFAMLQELGCDFKKKQRITTFSVGNQKIAAFLDPSHAIKLIRNAFGDLKIIIDDKGNRVEFKYIKFLLDLQDKEGLHLGTKLRKAHVDFTSQKMKVCLATQLFSNSVADALEFCEINLKLPQFYGSSHTAKFIRIFNNLFDCLNSRSLRPCGWKKAIFGKNYGDVIKMFSEAELYIKKLKLETGQLLITSRRKTGFVGMLINMSSALSLYESLVIEKKYIEYLPLYKISQDHLELFFSAIRARGGYNNNPNAVQFKAAYKRLLIRAEIRDHGVGNCIPLEQITILNCPTTADPVKNINNLTDRNILIDEDDSILYGEYLDNLELSQNEYTEQVVMYIAGFIAKKLSKALKCEECVDLLHGTRDQYEHSLIAKKTRGGLTFPSLALVKIVQYTEKIVKQNLLYKNKPERYYMYIYIFLMEHFENGNIFCSGNSEHESSHKLLLLKSVILCYLDIRYKYYGKKQIEHISKRSFLTKLILFRHE